MIKIDVPSDDATAGEDDCLDEHAWMHESWRLKRTQTLFFLQYFILLMILMLHDVDLAVIR